jgi:hypothetical protein
MPVQSDSPLWEGFAARIDSGLLYFYATPVQLKTGWKTVEEKALIGEKVLKRMFQSGIGVASIQLMPRATIGQLKTSQLAITLHG